VSAALYSSVIRERFRRPRFRGRVESPDAVFEDVNPLCGDRIRIECRLDGDVIAEARHHGDSCAVSTAAADVLLELAVGRPVAQAAAIPIGDVLERLEADIRPSRMKCVALPLGVLQAALARKGATS
jgi:nitrogen fixation protein NifU and related proteins